jgi:hypothetical protein
LVISRILFWGTILSVIHAGKTTGLHMPARSISDPDRSVEAAVAGVGQGGVMEDDGTGEAGREIVDAVNGTIEVHPLAANLDVGFVHMPLAGDGTLAPVETLQQLRKEVDAQRWMVE